MSFKTERRSLLSSQARVQVPWIRVDIGDYTFGVYSKNEANIKGKDNQYYTQTKIKYPNYVKDITVVKVNGQVNQYTLNLVYGVTQTDDPNFIEKVISSVSSTRKIKFSYGDMSQPNYIYKDEEALITAVKSKFNISNGTITYTISAVSSTALNSSGSFPFPGGNRKPSDVIKEVLTDPRYKLHELFPGMIISSSDAEKINATNTKSKIKWKQLEKFIAGDDKVVYISPKTNISPIDYITYLVSCMIPNSYTKTDLRSAGIYVLTLHDAASYDNTLIDGEEVVGSYMRVQKVEHSIAHSDAFEIDIGIGNKSNTIVTSFDVVDDENYALLYNYNDPLNEDSYVYRVDNKGQLVPEWAPTVSSKNDYYMTRSSDIAWWTKVTQYPIKATCTIQGLIRPAILMSYVRINVIFPGGHKHIASGLYLITSQQDSISESGYRTTLSLTKISGDDTLQVI